MKEQEDCLGVLSLLHDLKRLQICNVPSITTEEKVLAVQCQRHWKSIEQRAVGVTSPEMIQVREQMSFSHLLTLATIPTIPDDLSFHNDTEACGIPSIFLHCH